MCTKLADLRGAVEDYAGGLDAGALSLAQARSVLAESARMQKICADMSARAAARISDLSPGRRGRREAIDELAREQGSAKRAAEDALETQRRLATLPKTAQAARRGEISPAQAQAVAAGAAANPEAEDRLLDLARRGSLAELTEESARAETDADPEARRRRQWRRRALRTWSDLEGMFRMDLRHTPETGARLQSLLAPFIDEARRGARAEERHETPEALAADGLMAMAEASLAAGHTEARPGEHRPGEQKQGPGEQGPGQQGPGEQGPGEHRPGEQRPEQAGATTDVEAAAPRDDHPVRRAPVRVPAKIIVRVDLGALLRGHATEGELCEIVGVGPVAVSAVRDLMDTGDPFLAAVVTDGEKLTGAVHLGRRPRALQMTALEFLYPTCAVMGCARRSRLEFDHRVDWAKSHITLLDLMDRLCPAHHHLKTTKGWALVEGTGKREFVAPDDPRHPKHRSRPPPKKASGGTGAPSAA